MKKRWAWWVIVGLLLIVLVYPRKLIVVPAYHITLIDQSGKPLPNTGVSELWQQTSIQRQEMLHQVVTDAQGKVFFPQRTIRASLVERVIGCIAYLSRERLAAPCGDHYSITAAGDLTELAREETISGIFKRQHSLVLTVKPCNLNEPSTC
ncbi:MAG TPA: hypothetical protein VHT24_00170 [Pseudacidobacterium sp.]|nr:hypothetical protein [Pseudacidobacterium sp.]